MAFLAPLALFLAHVPQAKVCSRLTPNWNEGDAALFSPPWVVALATHAVHCSASALRVATLRSKGLDKSSAND